MGTTDPTFPVIDLSSIISIDHLSLDNHANNPKVAKLVQEIGNACEKWGFFQVINHGIPLQKLEKLDAASRKFFGLPLEEKSKLGRDSDHPNGYLEGEHTENHRDWKEVFDFTSKDPTAIPVSPDDINPKLFSNRWPESMPELRAIAEAYVAEVEKLSFKLNGLIALSLGLPSNRFDAFFEDQMSLVKLNYYPSCPSPDQVLGIAPHKDACVLTILAQDNVGGLQIRRKTDGEWVSVTPIPGSFIINVGDVIQVWSNDKYESIEHRAKVNSKKERVSIGYFQLPSHHALVKPLDELVNNDIPSKYKPLRYGELYATKRKNDLKKVEEELVHTELLQISHFKNV